METKEVAIGVLENLIREIKADNVAAIDLSLEAAKAEDVNYLGRVTLTFSSMKDEVYIAEVLSKGITFERVKDDG